MKKLGKKLYLKSQTVEAYGCYCSCYCSCAACTCEYEPIWPYVDARQNEYIGTHYDDVDSTSLINQAAEAGDVPQ